MKKKTFAAMLLALCLLLHMVPGYAAGKIVKNYSDVRQAVAVVATVVDSQGSTQIYSHGTGFFVDNPKDGVQYLITNHHVVEDYLDYGSGQEFQAKTADGTSNVNLRLRLLVYIDKNEYVNAQVVDSNENADIAVVKLEKPIDSRMALSLRVPDEKMQGSRVYAVGYPSASDSFDVLSQWGTSDCTYTAGTISRLITESGTVTPMIQTDAEISGGNSGGPLVNEQGEVLGVNQLTHTIFSSTPVADTAAIYAQRQLYYAINVSEAISLLERNNVDWIQAGDNTTRLIVIIAAAVAAVALIALVVFLVLRSRKKPGKLPPHDSGLRIQCAAGALAGQRFMLRDDVKLTLGHNASVCNVVFPPETPGVSNRHCEVWVEKGKVYLQDLNSSYGTFLASGARLGTHQATELHVGDSFYLGSFEQSFVVARKGGN